jgi:Flp pilus assembly protein TadG
VSADRWAREDGNTLVLFPAAILIMFVLAAIAVDAAVTLNARREVADIAATAANDAVTALAAEAFYGEGTIEFDLDLAAQRVAAVVGARGDDRGQGGLTVTCAPPAPVPGDPLALRVVCRGTVDLVVSRVGWLGLVDREVSAAATARADHR